MCTRLHFCICHLRIVTLVCTHTTHVLPAKSPKFIMHETRIINLVRSWAHGRAWFALGMACSRQAVRCTSRFRGRRFRAAPIAPSGTHVPFPSHTPLRPSRGTHPFRPASTGRSLVHWPVSQSQRLPEGPPAYQHVCCQEQRLLASLQGSAQHTHTHTHTHTDSYTCAHT